tara:strand:- start:412 stop:1098 length:687 start_codon:yes stop_codon:yes gene_type:complete
MNKTEPINTMNKFSLFNEEWSPKKIYLIGISGIILFITSSFIGGFLIENYSISSQYISETYAIDTRYGILLRVFGYFPSGIFFTLFCFLGINYFPASKLIKIGFFGLGLLYGLGTILVTIFPCDSGCNPEYINPSISQIIHNIAALVIYAFVPVTIVITGIGFNKFSNYKSLSQIALVLGILIVFFVYLLFANLHSEYVGFYQRIIELFILGWILACALKLKKEPIVS